MANVNEKRGEELNQLSRLSFDIAANLWYASVLLDILAALASLILSFVSDDYPQIKLVGALIVLIVVLTSYIFRFKFTSRYDNAETMRRQSVLTEGLGYPIKNWMFSRWRESVGKTVLNRFKLAARNDDYYRSRLSPSPRRLAEMTLESAFWTRQLYLRLLSIARLITGLMSLILVGVIIIILTGVLPSDTIQTVVYGLFVAVPLIISINCVGWVVQLQRLERSLKEIERDLDELISETRVDEPPVLRLVSEYNCQVVAGFPIPNWVFKKNYGRINKEWDVAYGDKVK